jgi:hypothetical protein
MRGPGENDRPIPDRFKGEPCRGVNSIKYKEALLNA